MGGVANAPPDHQSPPVARWRRHANLEDRVSMLRQTPRFAETRARRMAAWNASLGEMRSEPTPVAAQMPPPAFGVDGLRNLSRKVIPLAPDVAEAFGQQPLSCLDISVAAADSAGALPPKALPVGFVKDHALAVGGSLAGTTARLSSPAVPIRPPLDRPLSWCHPAGSAHAAPAAPLVPRPTPSRGTS